MILAVLNLLFFMGAFISFSALRCHIGDKSELFVVGKPFIARRSVGMTKRGSNMIWHIAKREILDNLTRFRFAPHAGLGNGTDGDECRDICG